VQSVNRRRLAAGGEKPSGPYARIEFVEVVAAKLVEQEHDDKAWCARGLATRATRRDARDAGGRERGGRRAGGRRARPRERRGSASAASAANAGAQESPAHR